MATEAPGARLLGNGRYAVLVTASGTGRSRWQGTQLTAWTGDRTEDGDGFFVYLRDLESGRFTSLAPRPAGDATASHAARATAGSLALATQRDGIESTLEICVPPDADAEVRRATLVNRSKRARTLELTSYAEVVLNDAAAHAAHPAFSKLFVETDWVAASRALLARRRPRSASERTPWLVHALAAPGAVELETDRARFLGRGRSASAPRALALRAPLSGTVGSVLDPVVSLRCRFDLAPGERVEATWVVGAADEREAALAIATRFADADAVEASFAGAAAWEARELARLGLTEERAAFLHELGAAVLYGHPALRADAALLRRARGEHADLWRHAVAQDRPFAVCDAAVPSDPVLRELLVARAFWGARGAPVDLVVVCDDPAAFDAATREALAEAGRNPGSGGIALRRRAELDPREHDVLLASARLVVRGRMPTPEDLRETPPSAPSGRFAPAPAATAAVPPGRGEPLRAANGFGGFARDGREYVVRLEPDADGGLRAPPMPWINTVSNEGFGFLVSESGAGYTWSGNSRENRLTPWSNDPISDPHGEALYVRDEESGSFWSPLPGPVPHGAGYEVRHGFGYTTWRHESEGLEQEVCQFAAAGDPLKVVRVRIRNPGAQDRRLSLFSYHRLVLGGLAEVSARTVTTDFDAEAGATLAENHVRSGFGGGIAFAAVLGPLGTRGTSFTTDRAAFLGRHGDPSRPAALCDAALLDGAVGAGLDPCAAWQVSAELEGGSTLECSFLLGEAPTRPAVRALLERWRRPGAVEHAFEAVREHWRGLVSAVEIETPSAELDLVMNGWLLYQVLSCRLWGRSAFYQSGGAFGFRDQLQDAAALVYARPDLTRAQILLHAAHQFAEGDVLHWWHPPAGRGIRTRFCDDLVWLPYVTAFYVETTGDLGLLDERAPFLRARELAAGEDEAYLAPEVSSEQGDVYTHCCRALDRALTRGAHGLPLMGTGDWNDGMNRVGREGRGESVWMGFFLHFVLGRFLPLCDRRGDRARAERYRAYQTALAAALNDAGWDGAWYRRAYYDDGTPLGSAQNDECRIDAIAQAWSVISGVAPRERAELAMQAVEHELVSDSAKLIRLLWPPFDKTAHDPGYIKGYVPGIRENGGQYTHGACWVVRAAAELGWRDRALELLERISPVAHARTPEQVAIYQVEPYVVVADIYGTPPHVGRGGWSWYTGSAGWFYRIALESLLGLRVEGGDTLVLRPRVPDGWPRYRIRYRLPDGATRYEIEVDNPNGRAERVVEAAVDGVAVAPVDGAARIPLSRDRRLHRIALSLG